MEPPFAEPPFDGRPVVSGLGQATGQPQGAPTHLFGLGQGLLGDPPPVAPLERVGEPAEVPER